MKATMIDISITQPSTVNTDAIATVAPFPGCVAGDASTVNGSFAFSTAE